MKDLFGGFYGVDDEGTKSLWNNEKSIFVFDTNVLLLLYRCEKETRDAFFSQWEKIKGRVWLPYHVCLEYQRNRLTAIKDHVMELENAGKHLRSKALEAIALNSLEVKHASTIRRYESLKGKLDELNDNLKSTVDQFVVEQIHTRISEADFLKNHDTVRDRIGELADYRIGTQPDQNTIDKLEAEGEARFKNKIPPGYEDEKVKGEQIFNFNGVTYKRKFGDWFIWKEILNYVESRETSSVVYVTNDEKKDWWYEIGGRTRGPQEALKTELALKGNGSVLFLYNSSSFLNAANQFLQGAMTSEEAILEIERVSADTKITYEIKFSKLGHKKYFEGVRDYYNYNKLFKILKEDDLKNRAGTDDYYLKVGGDPEELFLNMDDDGIFNLEDELDKEILLIEAELESEKNDFRKGELLRIYSQKLNYRKALFNEIKRRISKA